MNCHKAYYLFGACLVLLLAALPMAPAGAAQAPAQESVTITLQAPAYQLVTTQDGYTQIDIEAEGYSLGGLPGQALLPHRLVDVALPPDVDWDSLSLALVDVRAAPLPGAVTLRLAVPDQSASGPDAYAGPAGEPPVARIAATGQMRKWRLARVDLAPFRYDPATGALSVVEQATVELRFARTGQALDAALMADTAMDALAAERLINYDQALAWYPTVRRAPQAVHNYIIMTTNAIESNSTKLASFIAAKTAKGYSVLVVTEDDYGGLTGPAPNGREEKVRQWLINNYSTQLILYVLLIGEPTPGGSSATSMPMKMCWPRRGAGSDEESPTDYFYADLTGDWDVDNDTFYGEYTDDFGPAGGVDFNPEVFVGRIPFYGSYTDLDAILQKTIDYGNAVDIAWRDNILLPMSFSAAGYDGAPLAEQMWDDYLSAAGYSRWRQYQQGNGACSVNSSYASEEELRGGTVVRDRWAVNHYGIVCWWGHGSAASASVGYDGCWDGTLFDNTQTASLNDNYPSFTYQCSCTNGYPENSGNLQYSILKRGGIATVSASRVSWFNTGVGYGDFDGSTTNSGIGYEYVQNIAANIPAGESLYWAKSSMTPTSNTRLMNFYDFNLYGDPSIGITAHGTPHDSRIFLPLVVKAYVYTPSTCPIDSSFNGSADGWYSHSGTWYYDSNYLYTYGLEGYWSSASYAADFSNFDYQARMMRYGSESNANSLVFRGTPDPLTAAYNWYREYKLSYSRDGYYSIWKRIDGGAGIPLVSWTYTSAINQGDAWNTLRVVANGTSLTFYINGSLVWSGADSSLSSGRAGVNMYADLSTGEELLVDWALLCNLPKGAAAPAEPVAPAGPTVPGDENQHY